MGNCRISPDAPPRIRVQNACEKIHERVDIRREVTAVDPHILSRIDNYRDVFVGDYPAKSANELRGARTSR